MFARSNVGVFRSLWNYEYGLLLVLGLGQGILFFDRLSLSFLSPLLVDDLHLTNRDFGQLAAGMAITWGISGVVIGWMADHSRRRKSTLLVGVVVFSICSTASGLAASFSSLFLIRVLMGIFEGPILPISQSLVADASAENRRGLNMGMLQNLSVFLIAQFLGPLLLTRLGASLGWRAAFYITGVPGILIAVLIARFVRPDISKPITQGGEATMGAKAPLDPAGVVIMPPLDGKLAKRNFALCVLLACSLGGWMILMVTFLPLYLTRNDGLSVRDMGFVLSMLGAGGIIAAVAVPGLSDRIGRKAALLGASAGAFIIPIAVLLNHGDVAIIAAAVFVGSITTGCFPLYISVIPAESLPAGRIAGAVGLTGAAAEIIGGTVFPMVAGRAADALGLQVVFFMMIGLAVVGFGLILCLTETAPRKRRQSADSILTGELPAAAPGNVHPLLKSQRGN